MEFMWLLIDRERGVIVATLLQGLRSHVMFGGLAMSLLLHRSLPRSLSFVAQSMLASPKVFSRLVLRLNKAVSRVAVSRMAVSRVVLSRVVLSRVTFKCVCTTFACLWALIQMDHLSTVWLCWRPLFGVTSE
jgi:hypothetical protein